MWSSARSWIVLILVASIAVGACQSRPEASSAPPVTVIADTTSELADGTRLATFGGQFTGGASTNGTTTVFVGQNSDGVPGVHAASGDEIRTVADAKTSAPESEDPFTFFDHPSVSGEQIAFVASRGEEPPAPFGPVDDSALYRSDFDGNTDVIVDTTTPIPNGEGTFTGFFGASHDDGKTSFTGFGTGDKSGIYTVNPDGQVDEVISTGTPTEMTRSCLIIIIVIEPCGPTDPIIIIVIVVSGSIAKDGDVAFCAADADGKKAIYALLDGELQILADTITQIPDGDGAFTDFGVREGIDGGRVAFLGYGNDGQAGIYEFFDGKLRRVADTTTTMPGSDRPFSHFPSLSQPAVEGDAIVFYGAGDEQTGGLFVDRAGELSAVVAHGDTLNGETVRVNQEAEPVVLETWWDLIPPLYIQGTSFSGGRLAFFADGAKQGIYLADVE